MWRLTFYQLVIDADIFAAERKFLPFALLEHNPEVYLEEFQAWLEHHTGKLYAKQTVSRTMRQVGLSVIKR